MGDGQRSDALLSMTSSMPMVLFTFDRHGVAHWASGAGFESPGMEPAAAYVGRTLFEIYADFPQNAAAVRRCLAGEPIEAVLPFYDSVWDTRLQPVFDADGQVIGGRCMALDITQRVRAEAEARAATNRLAAIVEHVDDTVVLLDAQGHIIYASPAIERLTGLPPGRVVGQAVSRLLPPAAYDNAMRMLDEVVASGDPTAPQELLLRHLDGHEVPVELVATNLLDDPDVGAVAVTLRDVTQRRLVDEERRAYAGRLEALNHELREAVRVRDDLLSMSSHELRTPLTPIVGGVELLLDRCRELLDDDLYRVLGSVDRNARRLLRLVDDLLMMSGAQAGVLRAHPRPVRLGPAIEQVLEDLGEIADAVEVRLETDASVVVDPAHLDRILTNLIDNADTYGRPPIEVTVRARQPWVDLFVVDHGDGVPEDFLPRMWDRFAQADSGDARASRGLGLGLPIVAELARLDGLELCYGGDGTGARFRVSLPMVAEEDATP
jgi:PAS domain S-box-containing protein